LFRSWRLRFSACKWSSVALIWLYVLSTITVL
jgi:hypothetical protein